MVRKGGATAEFVYGLGISSLQPADQVDHSEETPLRFVSVQLQLSDSSKNLDVDVHAFLFESDGTYVDCVFYKNPTLAGKSVRLLQQDKELLVDLRYIPQRCSFIVCTLAIYSGGTVAQLGDGSVQLSALVPRLGLEENADFPHLPCGQLPPGSSEFYEWDYVTRHVAGLSEETPGVELGSLIKAAREGTHVQFELADTEWRLPDDQEEPAGHHAVETREYGTRRGIGLDTGNLVGGEAENEESEIYRRNIKGFIRDEGTPTRHGTEQQADGFVAKQEIERHIVLTGDQGDVAVAKRTGRQTAPLSTDIASCSHDEIPPGVQAGRRPTIHTMAGRRGDYNNAQFRDNYVGPFDREQHPDDRGGKRSNGQQREGLCTSESEEYSGGRSRKQRDTGNGDNGAIQEAVLGEHKGIGGGANRFYRGARSDDKLTGDQSDDGEPLLVPHLPVDGHEEEPGVHAYDRHFAAGRHDWWRDSVERRLSALERSVESIGRNLQMVATATSDMQKNNKLYIQELRERFTELKSDVASDIESALSGPVEALSVRVKQVKDEGGADAKQLAEQKRKLWAVDRMVLLHERNWHLLAQSISELRFQLSGLEQRIEQAVPAIRGSTVPPTDNAKGLPLSLQSSAFLASMEEPNAREVLNASSATQNNATSALQDQGQTVFASQALDELNRIQSHAEAFGACMRRLASGTASDGLKGLNPIERRVLSFAGTPKVFEALQDLERALETINSCGPGSPEFPPFCGETVHMDIK
ncbi:uncharacterized protein EMH_0034470 [Eimeria mitis]|uniref:TerD domain-containing protein n=1 Tax=Eimeria mitis TaxID=44415 RepID=U6KDT8_9EIME|nr:uncharacterized protein EMH_0034470 [Eimeria mitis]CDJ36119.1 hypothetical protein, conserved [Eimeria mitis]